MDKNFKALTKNEIEEINKSIPISRFLEFDNKNKLVGFEKHIIYYPKTNTICNFSSQKRSYFDSGYHDLISVYQALYNVDFYEACQRLSNKNSYNEIQKSIQPATAPAPAEKKEIEETNISLKDLDLIEKYPCLDQHEKQYFIKRGFKPNLISKNVISLTSELIEAVRKINYKLAENLNYYFNKKYQLIILYRDTENKPITLRLYSFDSINKDKKKITIKGQKTRLYGLEHITKDTKKIVFVEGEEKAEAGNLYRKDKSIVFLSISGINIHKPAIEFIENNPKLEYYVLFDNDNRALERKFSYDLACKLNKYTENKILLLDLPSNKDKIDLDSYLLQFSEENKTQALESVLNNPYSISDYQDKHSNDIILSEFKREKVKHIYEPIKEVLEAEKLTIEQVRKQLPKVFSNFIQNQKLLETNDLLLISSPCGTGKTHETIEQTKSSKVLISEPTKEQRNETSEKAKIDANISLSEHCHNTLYKSVLSDKLSKDDKDNTYKTADSLRNKGYNTKKTFCPNNCKLSEFCTNTQPKTITSSIVETHAKTLVNQDNLKNFDILIKDESFIKIIFKTQQIDLEELDKMLWFYDDITLNLILKTIKLIFTSSNSQYEGKKLYKHVKSIFKNEKLNLKDLFKVLDIDNIKENRITKNDYDRLPDKKSLEALIFAFNNDFLTTYLKYDNFTNTYYFNIDYKKNIEADISIINLDATGNIKLLKALFPNRNILEYKPLIEFTGINYTSINNKTFNTSNLFPQGIPTEETEIYQLILKLSTDKKTLVVGSKTAKNILEPLLKNDNLFFESYGNNSRGSNKYSDCELVIVLPPSINLDSIIRIGKVFFGSVCTELEYKYIPTGFIKDGKELYISSIQFKDKRLNLILEQIREAEIYQALFRIKRDTKAKEFIVLGNIALKQYGLVPNNVLNSYDILPPKETKKSHQELRDFIKFYLTNILDKQQFVLKSEITNLQNFIKSNVAETIVNSEFGQTSYNIYSLFKEIFPNSTIISVSAIELKKDYFDKIVREEIKKLQKELGFLEEKFPIIDNNTCKILLKNDSALELAKEFYKEIIQKKPAPAPAENIISTSEKLEAGFNIEVNNLEPITYENISSSVFDDMKLLQNSISEVRKNLYQGYSVEYLHKELDINFLEFMKANNFEYEFLSKDNLDLDCREYDYTAFISNKYLDSLDSSTIEKYNVDFTKIFTTVTNFLTAKEQLESTEHSNYDNFVKNNIVSLITSLEKYLNGLYFKSKILDDNYFIELDNYLEAPNLTINQTYKRVFIYETIIHSIHIINSDIAENNRLKEVKNTSGIKEIILKVLNFFKLSELIAV